MKKSERKSAAKDLLIDGLSAKMKKDSQSFWLDLLQTIYVIEKPIGHISFEDSVSHMMDSTSYIKATNVLIKQKENVNSDEPYHYQSYNLEFDEDDYIFLENHLIVVYLELNYERLKERI